MNAVRILIAATPYHLLLGSTDRAGRYTGTAEHRLKHGTDPRETHYKFMSHIQCDEVFALLSTHALSQSANRLLFELLLVCLPTPCRIVTRQEIRLLTHAHPHPHMPELVERQSLPRQIYVAARLAAKRGVSLGTPIESLVPSVRDPRRSSLPAEWHRYRRQPIDEPIN